MFSLPLCTRHPLFMASTGSTRSHNVWGPGRQCTPFRPFHLAQPCICPLQSVTNCAAECARSEMGHIHTIPDVVAVAAEQLGAIVRVDNDGSVVVRDLANGGVRVPLAPDPGHARAACRGAGDQPVRRREHEGRGALRAMGQTSHVSSAPRGQIPVPPMVIHQTAGVPSDSATVT